MSDYSHITYFSVVFIKLKQVLRKLIKLRKFLIIDYSLTNSRFLAEHSILA